MHTKGSLLSSLTLTLSLSLSLSFSLHTHSARERVARVTSSGGACGYDP